MTQFICSEFSGQGKVDQFIVTARDYYDVVAQLFNRVGTMTDIRSFGPNYIHFIRKPKRGTK
jgi:hypothetical protein